MPRPIFFTKPAPTPLSYLCRRLTRARVRHFIGNLSTPCTFCMHCVDNQAFQECRQTRFLSTLLSTRCHYYTTPPSALVCTLPTLLCADCERTAKRLWEVVISVAPNGTPASRNRLSACRSRADTVPTEMQTSCRQSADECSCVQMVSTRPICLIINAVHTKSAECRQNGKITKTVCGPFGIIMRLLKKPTRDEAAEKTDARRVAPIRAQFPGITVLSTASNPLFNLSI